MKILVTGGAGFIGSHLVDKLLGEGNEVWSLDDLSTGKSSFTSHLSGHSSYHFVEGSTLNKELLQSLINEVDSVYHLAAVLGVKNCVDDPLKVIKGNIDGTKNVLEAAFSYGKKVIFSSTSEVYGKNNHLPFHEDDDRVYGSAARHRWSYAVAKSLDEHLCLAYAKKGLPVTILRYFNTYGPRATSSAYGGVIPRFIMAALLGKDIQVYGTGEQTRCFTYIEDTVAATYLAMNAKANGCIINIGNHQQISIYELAHIIKSMTHSTSRIVQLSYEKAYGIGYEDMLKRQPDNTRMREILGYAPKIGLLEGLKRTIDWYKLRGAE
ncbi:NAD-dependent epimerase/dehydratase family protein [Bacillus horti]|uniref:UDP-glucose 4-epimerase n=1 Tax=Caldalkalibacillus horti TaxID=77523 RepID=A0ABT9W4C7_9BACI|nr:NAD-dependent epimerase/dehydratase family protein [Bacillus horti]MDQ0168098.1 UDP-glucose 4-epimerase [Bacillus horti]